MASPSTETHPLRPRDSPPSTVNHENIPVATHESTSQSASTSQEALPESHTKSQTEPDDKELETTTSNPPLPEEPLPPPLPDEPLPAAQSTEDDGWAPVWDDSAQTYYFYNRFTKATQWENPRIPEATTSTITQSNDDQIAPIEHAPGTVPYQPAPGTISYLHAPGTTPYKPELPATFHPAVIGGYNPAIHGDYDPTADYAQAPPSPPIASNGLPYNPNKPTTTDEYGATATFNRFTGRFQASTLTSDNFNDEAKSKRQMNAFFDVESSENVHDGRSLRAERAGKKLSKSEVKAFKEKRREKKEEKRRAWLRD